MSSLIVRRLDTTTFGKAEPVLIRTEFSYKKETSRSVALVPQTSRPFPRAVIVKSRAVRCDIQSLATSAEIDLCESVPNETRLRPLAR